MSRLLDDYEHYEYMQYERANECACCGEKIMGREYTWEGEYYCEECFDDVILPDEIKPEYEVKR